MTEIKSKLLRKTKTELCDIILRKDNVETELKNEIKELVKVNVPNATKHSDKSMVSFSQYDNDITKLQTEIIKYKLLVKDGTIKCDNFKDIIDGLRCEVSKQYLSICNLKYLTYAIGTIAVLLGIIIVIM